jgi:hypothetical protein
MNPIKGMVAVISNYGVGKTTFALECGYHPKDIVFVNDDVKEVGFENQFKEYVDLVGVSKKKKLLDLHAYCLDLIKKLPKSKVIIWDTWTQFQSTFPVYVKAHMNEFRNPSEWSANGKIKSGERYQEAYRYEGAALSELKTKCDLLILTFHLKQEYLNNVAVPGKFKPGHDRAIEKYADLRIWLTPNPDDPAPIGLVLKNIAKRELTEKGIRTSQVLPLRIETCNWDEILKYWDEPLGDRLPEDERGERPNSFELSLIEGTLTPEDKRLYEASLSLVEKQEAKEQAEQLMLKQSQEKAIKEYIAANLNGTPGPAKRDGVVAAIEAGELTYDGEVTVSKVNEWS